MLSILFSEFKEWGCPNCGCDSVTSGCFSCGGVTSGTCRHCKLTFEIRSDNGKGIVQYGSHPENPSDPNSESVMEYAHRIAHPRSGVSAGIGNQKTFVQRKENTGVLEVLDMIYLDS